MSPRKWSQIPWDPRNILWGPLIYFKPTSAPLANDQLDAQFLYFIIRLLQFSTCFEERYARHQEVKLY